MRKDKIPLYLSKGKRLVKRILVLLALVHVCWVSSAKAKASLSASSYHQSWFQSCSWQRHGDCHHRGEPRSAQVACTPCILTDVTYTLCKNAHSPPHTTRGWRQRLIWCHEWAAEAGDTYGKAPVEKLEWKECGSVKNAKIGHLWRILSVFTVNERFAVVFTSQLTSVIDKFGCASWISAVYLFVFCRVLRGHCWWLELWVL